MPLLHHHDLVVASLSSGSRGNATYIGTPSEGLLIDCGLSTKQILRRMEQFGLGEARILGVLITHEHTDHVASAAILHRALLKRQGHPAPFYMTAGTRRGLPPRCTPDTIRTVRSGQPFRIGPFRVEPWTIPHDTVDPIAFAVEHGGIRAGVITDLGRSTRLVERQLGSLDIALLEFNHDPERLMDGPYPWRLKQRVRGAHGHLSNRQAAMLLERSATARLRHLVLAHLSEENNTPVLALEAAHEALGRAGRRSVTLHVAGPHPLDPIRVGAVPRSHSAQLPLFAG